MSTQSHINNARTLIQRGQFNEAAQSLQSALRLDPNLSDAHYLLGYIQSATRNSRVAIESFQRALALNPNYAEAWNALAVAFRMTGQLDEAMSALRSALAIEPSLESARNNLAQFLKDAGLLDEALAEFRTLIDVPKPNPKTYSNYLYTLHFHPAFDAKQLYAEHRKFNAIFAEPLKTEIPNHANDRTPDRRLRVGIVSPDLRWHPVGRFIQPWFAHRDRTAADLFVYSDVASPDDRTRELHSTGDTWRNIFGAPDVQVAKAITYDRIDILIDLTMHMASNRMLVFARKPAPVQATYLAYCGTTGLDAIDFRITDPFLDSPDSDLSVYSEKSISLAHSYWCDAPPPLPALSSALPAERNGFITFGCFNEFAKITLPTLRAWATILRELPTAHLAMACRAGEPNARIRKFFADEQIDSSRLNLLPHAPFNAYIARYNDIDIALDPFPYTGGTTTCDALWMGVPVVSIAGRTGVSRSGLSILSNVGLRELVARSTDAYHKIAVDLARDLPRLASLRSGLRDRMLASPLTNAKQFATDFDAVLRAIWKDFCAR